METTPNLNLPLLDVGQAQKEVTVNEALAQIDALQAGALSRAVATPPTSPNDGNAYIVAPGATGAWLTKDAHIAYYFSGWKFIPPKTGMHLWVYDEACDYYYTGTQWIKSMPNVPATPGNRNAIINGSFDIWQRGTSFSTTGYTADRWACTVTGAPTVFSITRENYTELAPLSNHTPEYFLRMAVSGGSAGAATLSQRLEDVRTMAGQTITLSFWARAASAGMTMDSIRIRQEFGSGGSTANTYTLTNNPSFTTSWARYSYTVSLASIAGKTLGSGHVVWFLFYLRNGTTNTATIDFADVQIEAANSAGLYDARTFGQELSLCQRYFCKTLPLGTTPAHGAGLSGALAATASGTDIATAVRANWQFPVPMRTTPTITLFNPSNAAGSGWRNVTASTDLAGVASSSYLSAASAVLFNNATATTAQLYAVHATANAEL